MADAVSSYKFHCHFSYNTEIQDTETADAVSLEKGGKGANGEDYENDLEANASAFEALERDFQDVS